MTGFVFATTSPSIQTFPLFVAAPDPPNAATVISPLYVPLMCTSAFFTTITPFEARALMSIVVSLMLPPGGIWTRT